jgi:hypothetical protein
MTEKPRAPKHETEVQGDFYLIFDEVAKIGSSDDAMAQEIHEIEEIGRMVQDVAADDEPRFLTST